MIAIIPARGGSKGLPGKNIRLLNGKPLIAHTIEAAISSNVFEQVIVNTDCSEIARIGEEYGANIPFIRPSDLATDSSSSIDMIRHTITWFEDKQIIYNNIALLQPTSPLRNALHIKKAFEIFHDTNVKSLISFVKEQHPIYWNKRINNEGLVEDLFKDTKSMARQNYIDTYVPNGAIYMFKSNILEGNTLYTDNTYGYIMDSQSSIDIDTQEDFDYCEFLMRRNF